MLDLQGETKEKYFGGAKQDELVASNDNYVIADHLGTVRKIIDGSDNIVSSLKYSAFGELVSCTGMRPRFRYTGKMFDDVTGLQWNVNRWYDASVGRWISEDPIGFRGRDVNLCRYVHNTITFATDPNGKLTLLAVGQYALNAAGIVDIVERFLPTPPQDSIAPNVVFHVTVSIGIDDLKPFLNDHLDNFTKYNDPEKGPYVKFEVSHGVIAYEGDQVSDVQFFTRYTHSGEVRYYLCSEEAIPVYAEMDVFLRLRHEVGIISNTTYIDSSPTISPFTVYGTESDYGDDVEVYIRHYLRVATLPTWSGSNLGIVREMTNSASPWTFTIKK